MKKMIAGLAGLALALHAETAQAGGRYTPLNPPAWQMNAYYRSVYQPPPQPIVQPPQRLVFFQSTDSIYNLASENWPAAIIYVKRDGTEIPYIRTTWQNDTNIQAPPFQGPYSRFRIRGGWNYEPERRRQTRNDEQ